MNRLILTWRVTLALAVMGIAHIQGATVTWIGESGDWSDAANWSTGALPGPDDDVVIDRPGVITVAHSSGTHAVKSIVCQEALELSGGVLTISGVTQLHNVLPSLEAPFQAMAR